MLADAHISSLGYLCVHGQTGQSTVWTNMLKIFRTGKFESVSCDKGGSAVKD